MYDRNRFTIEVKNRGSEYAIIDNKEDVIFTGNEAKTRNFLFRELAGLGYSLTMDPDRSAHLDYAEELEKVPFLAGLVLRADKVSDPTP